MQKNVGLLFTRELNTKMNIQINLLFFPDNIVSGQDVFMILSRTALFQQDKLKFGCSPSNVARWGGVTHIILSKNTSAGFLNIVSVILDLKTLQNETIWHRSGWRNRATAIREYVNPVTTSSGLEFEISADYVLCSDEGTYRCKIIGSSTDNRAVQIDKFKTVKLKGSQINQKDIIKCTKEKFLIKLLNMVWLDFILYLFGDKIKALSILIYLIHFIE